MLLSILIFAATLSLVIIRPRGIGIGTGALIGAILALVFGVVHPGDIPVVWNIVWNATLAFVAIVIISLILDEAGLFAWAALKVIELGRGHGGRLFLLLGLLSVIVTLLFANDGAALILTPLVAEMLKNLKLPPSALLAFVMSVGFLADTTSIPLVTSNLVNIVAADYFAIEFTEYAQIMLPVNLVAAAASLAGLWFFFRRQIPVSYSKSALALNPVRDPLTFRVGFWVLGLLLVSFFLSGTVGLPLSLLAGLGALILMAVAVRWPFAASAGVIELRKVIREAPWQIVLFSLGMYLVVFGMRNAGLTDYLSVWLSQLAHGGIWLASLGTSLTMAIISGVMNNMPTVMLGAIALEGVEATPLLKSAMVYALIIGCDLGPKLTPIGSLATLLWLSVLERKGIVIGLRTYFLMAFTLTIPVLVATTLALTGWLLLVEPNTAP